MSYPDCQRSLRDPSDSALRRPAHRSMLYIGSVVLSAALAAIPGGRATASGSDPWETITAGGETRCSDGSPYRFHVRSADPERLLIFFNGGGACWNSATCDPQGKPTYRVTSGAGSGNDPREYDGAFALDNPENPFRDWSQVFVSYCTGDVHLGHHSAIYDRKSDPAFTVHHDGRVNADAVIDYVVETLPTPGKILVAGGSAGAIASPVYAAVIADRYPNAQVLQLGGGGAGYRTPPPVDLWNQWGTVPALPAVLDTREVRADTLQLLDLYRLAAEAAPALRFHTYDNAFDGVQEQFMMLLGSPGPLLPGLDANLGDLRKTIPALRSYVAPGKFHTLLRFDELYTRESGGVRAVDWVQQLLSGEDVANVHCDPATCDGAP